MNILVIADVHGNLAALEAVLADVGEVEHVWCLGDLVGYGPNPNEVVQRLRELPLKSLVGNHDLGSTGKADLQKFNADARASCEWTATVLAPANQEFLTSLQPSGAFGDVFAAHGSPRDPVWEYISNMRVAEPNFGYFSTDICLVGHSHVPLVFRWRRGAVGAQAFVTEVPSTATPVVAGDDRIIFNPGSVGQPRDGDPRAAYAVFAPETRSFRCVRVPYDVSRTQAQMRSAGLPDGLALRLQYGW